MSVCPSCTVDWRLWFGPGVRFPPEALHPCSGDPVVPITRTAAWSQGENSTVDSNEEKAENYIY